MIEASIVTYDGAIIDYKKGQATTVEFNFERVWHFIKKHSHMISPFALNFYHVHPPALLELSELDKNCMQGFYIALGFPIFFHIVVFDNDDLFDVFHTLKAFEYSKDSKWEKQVTTPLTNDQLLFLKQLSYSEKIEEGVKSA